MALTANQQWWVRLAGNNLNGGGYDSTVSGAGTNYANQDSPQLSLTDLASVLASTTLTSAVGGFTAAMVGNIIRIASGTNFTAGYYCVTGYTNTNTVTIDRACTSGGNGSAGVGRLGGGFASLFPFVSGGTVTQPVIATPISSGHTVNVQGGGTDTPSSADYVAWGSSGQYSNIFTGTSAGAIKVVAFNGRPWIELHGMFYNIAHTHFSGLLFKLSSQYVSPIYGMLNEGTTGHPASSSGVYGLTANNCVFDCGGLHSIGFHGSRVTNSLFKNTGALGTNENTYPAVLASAPAFGGGVFNCEISNWVGKGIQLGSANPAANCVGNNVHHCTGSGITWATTSTYVSRVTQNSVYSNGNDGIVLTTSVHQYIRDNILYGNTGYGLRHSGTNPNQFIIPNRNAYGANTVGAITGCNAGADDVTLTANPFTNSTTGDCSLNTTAGGGAACRGTGSATKIGGSRGVTEIAGNIGAWQGSNSSGMTVTGLKRGIRI